ncbi:hypothetical protein ACIBF5_02995 [Micromonospora sp. NPDC050417]|uniref:hypothetical protein n=1 Tax=Micromonospora sp. NPDC050417 TaxID=3364280 RepID=UPI0037B7DE52
MTGSLGNPGGGRCEVVAGGLYLRPDPDPDARPGMAGGLPDVAEALTQLGTYELAV